MAPSLSYFPLNLYPNSSCCATLGDHFIYRLFGGKKLKSVWFHGKKVGKRDCPLFPTSSSFYVIIYTMETVFDHNLDEMERYIYRHLKDEKVLISTCMPYQDCSNFAMTWKKRVNMQK